MPTHAELLRDSRRTSVICGASRWASLYVIPAAVGGDPASCPSSPQAGIRMLVRHPRASGDPAPVKATLGPRFRGDDEFVGLTTWTQTLR
jgi:hypothetical protein